MANLTPFATPKGGFPLRLQTQKPDGSNAIVTFPTSAVVNPGDAVAEAELKKVLCTSAADTVVVACS